MAKMPRHSTKESITAKTLERLARIPGRWPVRSHPGLYLKVGVGTASWTRRYRFGNQAREDGGGLYPDVDLETAIHDYQEAPVAAFRRRS
jgi:hypothetical protein